MSMDPENQKLFARMARGGADGEAAFVMFRGRYFGKVRSHLLYVAKDMRWKLSVHEPDDAADATDSMLAKLYRRLRGGASPPDKAILAYLKTSAWHELLALHPIREGDTLKPREGDEGRNWPQMISSQAPIGESDGLTVQDTIASMDVESVDQIAIAEGRLALGDCVKKSLNERQREGRNSSKNSGA